jgi:hypothetical protein
MVRTKKGVGQLEFPVLKERQKKRAVKGRMLCM